MQITNDSNHPVISVLGMHRSGTSCLTGSLQLAGLDLGPHSTWNRFNQRGNRENPRVNDLHDALLEANGGCWYEPPARIRWQREHFETAMDILSEYPEDRRWGFKDPKILIGMDGWRALIGEMTHVGIYRHPVLVARSLHQRNKLTMEHGFNLWWHYNYLLLREYQRSPFPMLSFDWDEKKFHDRLNRILPEIGLNPLGEEDRFFTDELRHHEDPNDNEAPALPEKVAELYAELCRIGEAQAAEH